MLYQCNTDHKLGPEPWSGEVYLIRKSSDFYEALIHSRGTRFHVIAGSYQNGNFLCVPNHGFGCELSRFSDTFWNTEQICKHLNPVDTESLVCGIRQLPVFDKAL